MLYQANEFAGQGDDSRRRSDNSDSSRTQPRGTPNEYSSDNPAPGKPEHPHSQKQHAHRRVPVDVRRGAHSEQIVKQVTQTLRKLQIEFTGYDASHEFYRLVIATRARSEVQQLVAAAANRFQPVLAVDVFPDAVEWLQRAHNKSFAIQRQQQPGADRIGSERHRDGTNGNGDIRQGKQTGANGYDKHARNNGNYRPRHD